MAHKRAAWITLQALDHISTSWCHRHIIVSVKLRGEAAMTDAEARQIDLLAWRYRRALPRHMAPRLPPHDPIIRALKQEAQHG